MSKRVLDDIMAGLGEALIHAKGETTPGMVVHVPEDIDVAAIRRRAGVSQARFALSIGVARGTLQNWEQKRRRPEGPARVLLALLDKNPALVETVLGKAA